MVACSFNLSAVPLMTRLLLFFFFHYINYPIDKLANHYCHWFSELCFSRISKSRTGYTFTSCVGYFTSPGIARYQIEETGLSRKTQAV